MPACLSPVSVVILNVGCRASRRTTSSPVYPEAPSTATRTLAPAAAAAAAATCSRDTHANAHLRAGCSHARLPGTIARVESRRCSDSATPCLLGGGSGGAAGGRGWRRLGQHGRSGSRRTGDAAARHWREDLLVLVRAGAAATWCTLGLHTARMAAIAGGGWLMGMCCTDQLPNPVRWCRAQPRPPQNCGTCAPFPPVAVRVR